MDLELLEELLVKAIEDSASDLHLTVGMPPAYRIQDEIIYSDYNRITKENTKDILHQIGSVQKRADLEKLGYCDFPYSLKDRARFRVSAFKQRGTLSLIFRVGAFDIPTADTLNLPDIFEEFYKLESGLLIVSGPSKSGRTTTVANIIETIKNTRKGHIITLEDPIEYLFRHNLSIVSQREVGIDIPTINAGIDATMRSDSDVLFISKLDNPETMVRILDVAQSGRLVILILNTSSAYEALQLIPGIFPEDQAQLVRLQLSKILKAVISQRLVPDVKGQLIPAFEIMIANNGITNLIRENKTHQVNKLIESSRSTGMIKLDDYLFSLYEDKRITREIALNFCMDKSYLIRKINALK